MEGGGAERVAAQLANAWADRGDLVTLTISFSGRGTCFYRISDVVRVKYLADVTGRTGKGLFAYFAKLVALRRLIAELSPDVVVSFLTNVNVTTLLATMGLTCRVIVSERTFPPAFQVGFLMSLLRRATYPLAEKVVMLSSKGIRWLNLAIPGCKGVVVPNPVQVPIEEVEPRLVPSDYVASDRKLLLGVGRLDRGKQFDQLIDAFAVLSEKHSTWDLVIVGAGPELVSLEQQVRRLGVDRRVKFPGRAGNVGAWYSRADLFVMTSKFEGFPNTLVEAMAHGCAAISYDCDTGPRDIIHHGKTGILVSPVGDKGGLIHEMDRLMGDDQVRLRIAEAAMEVRKRYCLSSILDEWDSLFFPERRA